MKAGPEAQAGPAHPTPPPTFPPGPRPTLAPSAGGDEEGAQYEGRRGSNHMIHRGPSQHAPLPQGFYESAPRRPIANGIIPNEVIEVIPNEAAPGADLLKAAVNVEALEKFQTPQGPPPPEHRLPATLADARLAPSGDWRGLATGLLGRNHLNLAAPGAQIRALGEARSGRAAQTLDQSLAQARQTWPTPFRRQVGLGLVALGKPGFSANSMTTGAALLGASTPGEVLKSVLGGLKGELAVLKLPPQARDDLGRLLAASGLDPERLGRIMGGFGKDGLSLAELDKHLANFQGFTANPAAGQAPGLAATEGGLTELVRFLGSLGASTEVIDQVMTGLKIGEKVTGETLRDLLRNVEAGGLARTLGPGDLRSLSAFLREMGASSLDFERLGALLGQTSGQLTLGGFLDFLDSLAEAPLVPGGKMEELRVLLEQVKRDDGLTRSPVFNEALIKLRILGDIENGEDFQKMSPALQALRGGLSGSEDFVGQQFKDRKEGQEQWRQFIQAAAAGQNGQAASAALSAQAMEGYGSETLSRQLAQKILHSRRRGLYRLKMNLNPAELGRLDIELAFKGGALTASIKAENRQAYEALGGQAAELKKALGENGLELTELTLAYDDPESGRTLTAELTAENREASRAYSDLPGQRRWTI